LIEGTRSFEWNGTNDAGARLESGMYIYRLTDGNVTFSRKLMLSK
jgi:flagellar hook assembly protein FlgD